MTSWHKRSATGVGTHFGQVRYYACQLVIGKWRVVGCVLMPALEFVREIWRLDNAGSLKSEYVAGIEIKEELCELFASHVAVQTRMHQVNVVQVSDAIGIYDVTGFFCSRMEANSLRARVCTS